MGCQVLAVGERVSKARVCQHGQNTLNDGAVDLSSHSSLLGRIGSGGLMLDPLGEEVLVEAVLVYCPPLSDLKQAICLPGLISS